MIDRYDTNEPVLNGKLEVEYKGMKAPATFHADMGDYAIDDPRLLKALSAPGKHALLFTFIAGAESDLLEGTLDVAAPVQDHDHHASRWPWIAALGAGLAAAIALILRQRRRNTA